MPASFVHYHPERGEFLLVRVDAWFNIGGVECAYCGRLRIHGVFAINDREGTLLYLRGCCVGCGAPIFRRRDIGATIRVGAKPRGLGRWLR